MTTTQVAPVYHSSCNLRVVCTARTPSSHQNKRAYGGLQVKKAGPNQGRLFYVCARDDGPPPHGRCDFFQWVKLGQRIMKPENGHAAVGAGGQDKLSQASLSQADAG